MAPMATSFILIKDTNNKAMMRRYSAMMTMSSPALDRVLYARAGSQMVLRTPRRLVHDPDVPGASVIGRPSGVARGGAPGGANGIVSPSCSKVNIRQDNMARARYHSEMATTPSTALEQVLNA